MIPIREAAGGFFTLTCSCLFSYHFFFCSLFWCGSPSGFLATNVSSVSNVLFCRASPVYILPYVGLLICWWGGLGNIMPTWSLQHQLLLGAEVYFANINIISSNFWTRLIRGLESILCKESPSQKILDAVVFCAWTMGGTKVDVSCPPSVWQI